MTFNTTSYIAGVGSVVAVLSTGFAGGYFLANPTHINPPNRLQRLAAEDHSAPATTTPKPEVVAAATSATAAAPAVTVVAPATSATQAQQPAAQQVPAQPAVSPDVKTPGPVHITAVQETTAPVADKADTARADAQRANADKERATEAKFAERKHGEARKFAEQQRKQRELEVATVAVRRIIHDRDAPGVVIRDRDSPELVENDPPEAPAPAMPHFNLFGQ